MANTAEKLPQKQEKGAQAPMAGTSMAGMPMTNTLRAMRDEMDRLFDSFSQRFGFPSMHRMFEAEPLVRYETSFIFPVPAVDVVEDDKAYRISAELPGMEEKNVDLSVENDVLTIRGEKQEEKEQKEKNYYLSERRYGSFQRSFQLPDSVDQDKIEASFEKGVLTVTLPKKPGEATQKKKISIAAK